MQKIQHSSSLEFAYKTLLCDSFNYMYSGKYQRKYCNIFLITLFSEQEGYFWKWFWVGLFFFALPIIVS